MDDLISRKAAINALTEMYCKSDEDGYVWIIRGDAWKRIDALPSVQKNGDVDEVVKHIKSTQEYLKDIGETWYADYLSDAIDLLIDERSEG